MNEVSYRPWLNIEHLNGEPLRVYRCVDHSEKSWEVPPHCHEHYELVFYKDISTKATIDGVTVDFKKGDIILLPPYSLHHFDVAKGDHAYTCIHIDTQIVQRLLDIGEKLEAPVWKKMPEGELEKIWPIVEMHHEAKKKSELQKHLSFSLLYWFFERALTFESGATWEATPFQKLLIYLDEHRLFHFRAEDAATFLGYSRPHFMNRFKKQFKINYNEFLTQRQIHWARQLLSSTKLSIESISVELGFKNPSYFIRVFKKITDVTPVQYRKKLLK